MKVKIYGAGSIGNHLAHASRKLGWEVDVCDTSPAALERMKAQIYPQRYGQWDRSINLFLNQEAPRGIYDLILIGTPPEYHLSLALDALQENPKAIQIEKPVCPPNLCQAQEFYTLSKEKGVLVFVGYDHVVGAATNQVKTLIQERSLGSLQTLDVEFREHWGGIFAAHPWLSGPRDSYLAYWERGGGASGEHSHALNLWQHFAHLLGSGRVTEVTATLDYVKDDVVDYDRLCAVNLKTENGLIGRVVQDVVTKPSRKWSRIQFEQGYLEWHCSIRPGFDVVIYGSDNQEPEEFTVEKTRPDDFIFELKHIQCLLDGGTAQSEISLERGLDTMLVVSAAHLSAQQKRSVGINYGNGYSPKALQFL